MNSIKLIVAIIILLIISSCVTGCTTTSDTDDKMNSILSDMGYETNNDTKTIVIYSN